VLRSALANCARWRDQGTEITVAVNLSALDLFDVQLPSFITALLTDLNLRPQHLLLEITESALMREPAKAIRILRELKERGVALAIDDFGTGHSSLAHLKRMPVDELKIDKSFVLHLDERDSDDFVIVRSTIELGHNMGLKVVAEGIESEKSWTILKALGCDMGQGYFMSRPLDADRFDEYLKSAAQPLRHPQIAL
jgi:diguanylate cyclase